MLHHHLLSIVHQNAAIFELAQASNHILCS